MNRISLSGPPCVAALYFRVTANVTFLASANHHRSVIARHEAIPHDLQIASCLPMTDLRNMLIFRHFNLSAKVANYPPVICTLCPINWVVTRNDALMMVRDYLK